MERAFVLGAGVSRGCGIPLTNRILTGVLGRLEKDGVKARNELVALIRYLYPNFQPSAGTYPNIEDFFTQIEMALEFNSETYVRSNLWPSPRLTRIDRTLKQALSSYLWSRVERVKSRDSKWVEHLVKFCTDVLRSGDVVVTFNWDIMFERANSLIGDRRFELRHTYSPGPKRDRQSRYVTLLKPHGSIDWFQTGEVQKVETRGPADFVRLGTDVYLYNSFLRRPHHHLDDRIPEIVPPSLLKAFRTEVAQRTWKDIYRALRRAGEIYIIGYSLPPEDQFARFVLRRVFRNASVDGLDPKITVVNPTSTVLDRFEEVVGSSFRVQFEHITFEKWLTAA